MTTAALAGGSWPAEARPGIDAAQPTVIAPPTPPSSPGSPTPAPTNTQPPATGPSTTRPPLPLTTIAPGVPAVPTGGSKATAPPSVGPVTSDSSPIVAAVQADINQIEAINRIAQSRSAVATAQAAANAAAANLAAVRATEAGASSSVAAAHQSVAGASDKLSSIAIAAYTGAAYSSAAAAPINNPGQPRGAFATTGTLRSDANELISLIADQERRTLAEAKKAVTNAQSVQANASNRVAAAKAEFETTGANLASGQEALAQTLRVATVAGAAATATPAPAPAPAPTTTAPGRGGPAARSPAKPDQGVSPTILGPPLVTAAELAGWFMTNRHQANTTVPIPQLAADYISAGQVTGVRGDLAFAQSIIETGYFAFPAGGQLVTSDNNFAGIGACDSCAHGYGFPDALTGVTAQEELLEAYASPTQVPTPLIGPVGVGGCCQTWMALAGTWATDPSYGISILTVYKAILDFAIPEQLIAAGLAPPGSAPPLPVIPSVAPGAPGPVVPPTTEVVRAPTLAPTGP